MTFGTRPARWDDLEQITEVFWLCWNLTYAHRLPHTLQSAMDHVSARARWAAGLRDPTSRILVATAVDDRTGTARESEVLGVVRFCLDPDGTGYLASLYVAPEAQGAGLGRALLAQAEDELLAGGVHVARLWVFEANAEAVAFYRRAGWNISGDRRTEAEFGEPEIGLIKVLAPHRQ